MSHCTDNPRTGRHACGQTFGGELQHCVARASWSTHPDGRAHITAVGSLIDWLWVNGGHEPANPAELGCTQDAGGRWRGPISDERRAQLVAMRRRPLPPEAPENRDANT